MKNLIFFSFLMLTAFSCKKESKSVCEIDNPLEDIEWLKEMHETFQIRQSPAGAKIFQYDYKGECVFWINDCVNCDDNVVTVYNENQDIICQFGGLAGLNTCPDFDDEKANEKILYDDVP